MKKENDDYIILTVLQALKVLDQFQDGAEEIGLAELSRRLNLNKNMVFRLLATLKSRNFIEQNGTNSKYRLGFNNLKLGHNYVRQSRLVRCSRPVLERIVQRCNESTYTATFNSFHSMFLDVVETSLLVRVYTKIGDFLPAHCSAAGKVQLASKSRHALESLLIGRQLKYYTDKTITNGNMLNKHLQHVAMQGYAIEDGEVDRDVRSVSAPIRDIKGLVVGAVSIIGPSCRFSIERMENELIPLVINGAREASFELGYHDSGVHTDLADFVKNPFAHEQSTLIDIEAI